MMGATVTKSGRYSNTMEYHPVYSIHTSFMNKMPRLAQISRLLSTNSYDRVRPVLSLQDLWTLHVSGIKHKNKGPYSCTMSTSLSRLGDKV